LTLAALCACAPHPRQAVTEVRFAPSLMPTGVARANADLAADFMELAFGLETGEKLDRLLRYERPVRVHLAGLEDYRPDVEALVMRLRGEAGLDVALTEDPAAAQIRVEAVPAAELARTYPTAACFIVPGETSWRGFRRRGEVLRWSAQTELEGAAIFLPSDAAPQEVRDCLHEELTQALGPANDLYRLPDSVWNDDNLHGVATPFDMLILRVLHQPELRSGMTREEAAARLPALFDRENPMGRGLPRAPGHPESAAWARAVETALGRTAPEAERAAAARRAVRMAAQMRPPDHRLAVSLLTLGRLTLRRDPAAAGRMFARAYELSLRDLGPQDVRTAHAGVHLAAVLLAAGRRLREAADLADRVVPVALLWRNPVLLAGLLSLKAEALLALGDVPAARRARLDSLRWARYGFGDEDGALAREQSALAALPPLDDG
jgi:hypothetical protein